MAFVLPEKNPCGIKQDMTQ